MIIIPQTGEIVNQFDPYLMTMTDEIGSFAEAWARHKLQARQVADRLDLIGERDRAERMRLCADVVKFAVCRVCGTKHLLQANLCRDRFCPICTWRLAMKRYSQMCSVVKCMTDLYPDSHWQFVTLTVTNCQTGQLGDILSEMSSTWNKILSRKSTKALPIIGWARSLEVTYNSLTQTVHPHYHVLIAYDRPCTSKWLVDAWLNTVNRCTSPLAQDFRNIRPAVDTPDQIQSAFDAVLETYKYSVKSKDLLEMPLIEFKLLDRELKGKRMQSFGGHIKEIARILNFDHEELDECHDDETTECPKCSSAELVEVIGKWCGYGYIWRSDIWRKSI